MISIRIGNSANDVSSERLFDLLSYSHKRVKLHISGIDFKHIMQRDRELMERWND